MTNHNHKNPRQYSDQIHCSHCGKQWDVNDPEPPECETSSDRQIKNLREMIKTKESQT